MPLGVGIRLFLKGRNWSPSSHLTPSGTHDAEIVTEEVQEPEELRVTIVIALSEDHRTNDI